LAALVGPTGAGKTTIVSLLPRFYDPSSGEIRIDGIDIRRFKIKSLREQISFVLQETLLFRAPVWQNIAYGKPEASRAEIIRADVIFVIDDGKVVDQGTHKELLARGGLYSRLYELQFRGEEESSSELVAV